MRGERQCYQSNARLLLRYCCCLNGGVLFPLLRCLTLYCTSTIQLGTKIIFVYSCRLSSCYLYRERYNTVKTNCGCVRLHLSFLLCALGYSCATKLMYPLGHIFKNVCSPTNFVISLLRAVLYDVNASSLNVTQEKSALPCIFTFWCLIKWNIC